MQDSSGNGSFSLQEARPLGIASSPPGELMTLERVFSLLERFATPQGPGLLTLMHGDEFRGQLVLDRSALCLAVDALGPRFGSRFLRAHPDVAPGVIDALRTARRDGRPLAEALSDFDEATLGAMRRFVRAQTTRALIGLAREHVEDERATTQGARPARWSTRWEPAAEARQGLLAVSFSPTEVYLEVAAHLEASPPDLASALFEAHAARCATAGLFLAADHATGAATLPLRLQAQRELSLPELRKLSHAVTQTAMPPALAAAGLRPGAVMHGSSFGDQILVRGASRIALFCGAESDARARIFADALGRVRRDGVAP